MTMKTTDENVQLALSIRQPWAWLVVNGFKDVENRSWPTKFRGRVWVHAPKNMSRDEYWACESFVRASQGIDLRLPTYEDLCRQCGGIVGEVDITGCVGPGSYSTSPWFVGPFGFTLANAKAVTLRPCRGALGFFVPEVD